MHHGSGGRKAMRFRTPVEMGGVIARLREERALSQRALAGQAELDQSAISRIESGRRDTGAHELYRIAAALGTTAHELLTEEDQEPALLRASDANDEQSAIAYAAFERAIDDYFAAMALAEFL